MEQEVGNSRAPALVIEYTDAQEGFKGWLVIDTLDHRLCAGGMRVQVGLTRDKLARMARNMTCKMRICGLRVDGAKSGIDYDPALPGKHAAMARFLEAIAPYVRQRYSMGPDMNVDMAELDTIGKTLGLDSVKMAIAGAQGWDISYFDERYRVLQKNVDGMPLGRIRVGYGVAVAALAVLSYLGIPAEKARVAIQGFGAVARAAAFGLDRKGVKIIALADQAKCVISETDRGLDIKQLLQTQGTLLPDSGYGEGVRLAERGKLFDVPADILIPAAVENGVTEDAAGKLGVRAVVPGANLALGDEAYTILQQRNILALPDLLTGSGGSLSMEGLFAPDTHPEPADVLAHVEKRMTELVRGIIDRSRHDRVSPTRAALLTCSEVVPQKGRPYGKMSD